MIVSDEHKAWLAGLFEGEATFTATKDKNGYIKVRFQLSMTDEDIVKRAAVLCGAPSISTIDPRPDKLGNQVQHYFHISKQRDVLKIIEWIRPYLGYRRTAQADKMRRMIEVYGKGER